jgi:outer membrane protein insertion porin family
MRLLLRSSGWLGVLLVAGLLSAFAQSALNTVSKIEIKHVGPHEISDELIRANVRVKVGDPYLPIAVDEDVRNLYATGFFYNIRVSEERTTDGVVLTYIVQAKPRLVEIKFSGNKKLSDAKLRKKVKSKVGEPLDEHKLFNDSEELQKLYQKSGYANSTVKYVLNIDEAAGRGTATFEVKESPKIEIKEVQFVGAEAFPEKKLRKVIKTRKHWMFSWLTGSGVLKDEQFEEDKEKLTAFYREKGYIDFEIRDVKFEYPTPDTMIIKFFIFEGKPYQVGAVSFKGTTFFPTNRVNQMMNLKVGATFTPEGLARDVNTVEDFYGARGHIDVTESTGNLRVNKIPNVEKNTMDMQYDVNEGQKSYIEKIEIRGNNKTKDKVIRRELAVSPGEVFNMVKVKLSRQRLEGLQFFEKVDVRPEPTEVPNRKNLVVAVEEKNTGNVTLGAGFSSVDSLVGFVDVSQGNFDLFNPPTFTGGGQKARLHLALGTERADVVLSFVEPWFLDRKLALGVDFFLHRLDYLSENNLYNQKQAGGRVSLTKALWSDFVIGSVSYTLENIDIINVAANAPPTITSEAGKSLLSTVGGSLAYDTRNSVQLPDRGQRTELIAGVTGGPLGGDQSFYKVELKSAWYIRGLFSGHVLELVGRTGIADAFGNGNYVPFYESYYLGGMYTLRGYKYRDIGPKEALTDNSGYEPVGGNTYWFGSAEYSIPIIERLRMALFYDIGMVYPGAFSFSPALLPIIPGSGVAPGSTTGAFASNWGIGMRINLPIGPLRLDYGIPLVHDAITGSSGRFQFGVGYTRDF